METDQNLKPRAYVFYSFLDEQTAKDSGIKQYTLAEAHSFILQHKTLANLFKRIYKTYFGINVQDCPKKANGCYNGIYFRKSTCERAIYLAVSTRPIGVGAQVTFYADQDNFAARYLCPNERAEYSKRIYGDDTLFYILSKKQAYKTRYAAFEHSDITQIDSTLQSVYTLHRDECCRRNYYFAATDSAEFVKLDIHPFLP